VPDLALVVSPRNRGWILDTVSQEIARYFPGTTLLHYGVTPLPQAGAYFFSHYSLFEYCLANERGLGSKSSLVFFTHPSHPWWRWKRVVRALNQCTKVLSMSSLHAEGLVKRGVNAGRVLTLIPGSHPEVFLPHERTGSGVVGLCAAYYRRKSPELIAEVVAQMPHRQFLLIGRGWENAPGFDQTLRRSNVDYAQPSYEDYPAHYRRMDVFLSPAKLEGGPIPLLEAMLSNAVPVASRTGFAPDLIRHGENGFLFDVGASSETVCSFIDQAYKLPGAIRPSVEAFTWSAYADRVAALVGTASGSSGSDPDG